MKRGLLMILFFNMKKNIIKYQLALLLILFFLSACSSAGGQSGRWYTPTVGTTWQWQLGGKLNTRYDVDLYDIDLFNTPRETIAALHRDGRRVICYFSAGTYEKGRPDSQAFPAEALGHKMEHWDERWVDIRRVDIRTIMQNRLKLAQAKGCDGVEPDNVEGYQADSGFALTAEDQIQFNLFLAQHAHALGLSIALKNDLDQVGELVSSFDFAVNEECHQYQECERLMPFIRAGKPVFNAEYASHYVHNTNHARDRLCKASRNEHFATLVLPLMLDDQFRYECTQRGAQ